LFITSMHTTIYLKWRGTSIN